MSYSAKPSQEYLKNAVMTASPEQLQLMLYDGAIRFTTRGLEALRAKNREATFNALDRAQRIVLELSSGIRPEIDPELAEQTAALYSFIYQRLIDANLHQNEEALHDALRILRYQRETWVMLMDKLRAESKPQTSPTKGKPPSSTSSDKPASSLSVEG